MKKIRSDFPMLQNKVNGRPLIYLDNSATTHKPQQVIDSIVEFYSNQNTNIHRGVHSLGQQASERYESVRASVKDFIGASSADEIIFTSGTTESINLIAQSFGDQVVGKGDEVIITEMEHHANIVPWQALCQRAKATLKVIPIDDQGVLLLDELESLISKKTKVISLTYVSNVLGTINPVQEVVRIGHDHEIPVIVDGAQAVQHMPVDVSKLDCDFFVFSGHKIFAETGVGVCYGKKGLLEDMPPYQYGGGMISKVGFDRTEYTDVPHRFEAGTRNISAVISLESALEYIKNIGFDSIVAHEKDLIAHMMKHLEDITGVETYGNAEEKGGIFSMNLDDIHHYDAAMLLDHMGIIIRSGMHCAQPLMDRLGITGTIRASLALYNTKDDIDRFIKGLKKVQEVHGAT